MGLAWLTNCCPSMLSHCWLGHLTCKVVREMICKPRYTCTISCVTVSHLCTVYSVCSTLNFPLCTIPSVTVSHLCTVYSVCSTLNFPLCTIPSVTVSHLCTVYSVCSTLNFPLPKTCVSSRLAHFPWKKWTQDHSR